MTSKLLSLLAASRAGYASINITSWHAGQQSFVAIHGTGRRGASGTPLFGRRGGRAVRATSLQALSFFFFLIQKYHFGAASSLLDTVVQWPTNGRACGKFSGGLLQG